jgi:hypothetical protein
VDIQEAKLRSASFECKPALTALMALLVISPFTAAAQKTAAPAKPATGASQTVGDQIPKLWYSEASHKDFRVEVQGDVFRADWINLPAAAAKNGASIRIECRRTGTKWVGSASVYQAFANPSAPAGKDTQKMCHLTTRFEVDAIKPEKIAFHTEALRGFDYSKCQVLQTAWEAFAWVPKK